MWATVRHGASGEARALLAKLHSHGWKNEVERDTILKRLEGTESLGAEDVAWMVVDTDATLRQAGLSVLQRIPFEEGAEALFPHLASRTEGLRRLAMQALQSLAGPSFPLKLKDFLSHSNPCVVDAALDWFRQNPSEQALQWIAAALDSSSIAVRRKAFSIVEATASPRAAPIALRALEDDDEHLRFRAIQVLNKYPSEAHIEPLLRHCHNDSTRVQDAALAALSPILSPTDARWNTLIIPLLIDVNAKARQLASRILATQNPAAVADSFLRAFNTIYGPARDRALSALRELGPEYIRAFLDRDNDPDPEIAALASSVAVTIRSPEVLPHCIRFIEGKEWWLRDRAAQLLADLKDERALPALLNMLSDPESDISAAAALGQWGTPKALPPLLEAYKKGTTDLRLEILDAFAGIRDPRVPGLLESILKADTEPLVQEKTRRLIAGRAHEGGDVGGGGTGQRVFEPVDFRANSHPTLRDLFRHARAISASDLHISVGTAPHVRVHGLLTALPLPPTTPEESQAMFRPILDKRRTEELTTRRQVDFCHKDGDLGRFRSNVYHERKGLNGVFRLVPYDVPNLTDIGMPESMWQVTRYSQGLVLVTGPAGCGKTTTLAAFVDRINETQHCHILTIEDPIEYVHPNKESLVNQREVPAHSVSFAKALRQALREDPDVILVGEMRDLETIALAITASETGHLVFATLHTTTASSTVDRIINAFPPDQQGQIRMMLADSLKAVVSQTLLPCRDGSGRIAAYEILRNTPNVAGLIREGKTFQIPMAIQTGSASGMVLMDNALLSLVQDGLVEPRVAYDRALRKEPFEALLPAEDGGET
jgi:twitching motility protein PilT